MSGHNHKLIKNLATCFGLGEMSFMPGTFGTLGGIPIFLLSVAVVEDNVIIPVFSAFTLSFVKWGEEEK